jgi:hypothetical protein
MTENDSPVMTEDQIEAINHLIRFSDLRFTERVELKSAFWHLVRLGQVQAADLANAWDEGAKAQADAYGMDKDTGSNPYREQVQS